jgi:alpha-tubulin suppressor-like RCC1 family protein
MKDIENTKKETPLKESPFLGLTGMGGGVNSLMWAGAAGGSGSIFAWGSNSQGTLGLNQGPSPTAGIRSSPTQIGTDTNWKQSYSAETTSVALKWDGTFWTWGRYSSPVQISGTTWAACKKGHQQTTIAVKTDGSLWGWGRNNSGRLGISNNDWRSSPTQIPGTWATGRNSFAVGSTGTMAIKSDGTLWSWGYHSGGCLGMNEPSGSWSSPRQVGTDTNWRSVHMDTLGGQRCSHGTKTDGTLWSWGENTNGQLGLNTAKISPGNRRDVSSPTQVGTDTTWMSTSYGKQFKGSSFFPKTDGTLWFLGGLQEGNGTAGANTTGEWYRSSPVLIGSDSFYRVSAGDYGGLAISGKNVED